MGQYYDRAYRRKDVDWGARRRRVLEERAEAMRERFASVALRRECARRQPRTADGRRFASKTA